MRRLSKYLALSPAGRSIVLRSLLLLPVVAALLRSRGMKRTRAWLERLGPRAVADASVFTPDEITTLVGSAAALLQTRCLPRSLVLWHFLRDRGTSAEIRFGVTKLGDGGLAAHAWVEFDGLPLNDGQDVSERYAVLPSFAGRQHAREPATLSF